MKDWKRQMERRGRLMARQEHGPVHLHCQLDPRPYPMGGQGTPHAMQGGDPTQPAGVQDTRANLRAHVHGAP